MFFTTIAGRLRLLNCSPMRGLNASLNDESWSGPIREGEVTGSSSWTLHVYECGTAIAGFSREGSTSASDTPRAMHHSAASSRSRRRSQVSTFETNDCGFPNDFARCDCENPLALRALRRRATNSRYSVCALPASSLLANHAIPRWDAMRPRKEQQPRRSGAVVLRERPHQPKTVYPAPSQRVS